METSILEKQAGPMTGAEESPHCYHQWVIDSPNGPQSRGVCRLCEEERYFDNFIEGTSWGYNVSLDQLRGYGSEFPVSTAEPSITGLAEDL